MANEYDKIFKENIDELLPFLAAKLLGIRSDQWEELPDELQVTVERKPDFLKKVTTPEEVFLLQIEFQAKPDPEMPYRMLEYYALLLRKYRLPVRQVVLQIGRPVNVQRARLTTAALRFRYQLINLRDVDYTLFLNSQQPEEILLAVLATFRGTEPRKVLRWLLEKLTESTRLNQVDQPSHRFERYANQLLVLAKLRNLEVETFKLLESMTLSLGIDIEDMYSFKQGEQRGEQRGEKQAKKSVVRSLYRLNQMSLEQIAEVIGEPVSFVKQAIGEEAA